MPSMTQNEVASFILPPGSTLSVVTDAESSGHVRRLATSTGELDKSYSVMSASETLTYGPFFTTESFVIACLTGSLSYATAQFDSTVYGAAAFTVPTTDPEVSGEVWNDGGTLKVSAGGV
jgi:hypothetical protein